MERSSTIRLSTGQLLGALVNPCADQADLVGREHLGIFAFRHEGVRVVADMGNGQDQIAVRAVADGHDRAVSAAFHNTVTGIESQAGFGLFGTLAVVTFHATCLKNGLDISVKGNAGFG